MVRVIGKDGDHQPAVMTTGLPRMRWTGKASRNVQSLRSEGKRSMFRSLLVLAVVVLLLTGCESDYPATGAAQQNAPDNTPPGPVRLVAAVADTVPRGTVVTGTLAAEDQVVLSFKVAGRLSGISVDLGSRVRKGQRLAHLDPTDFRLRVQQAEAALQQARARLGLPLNGTEDRVEPERTPLVRQARAM